MSWSACPKPLELPKAICSITSVLHPEQPLLQCTAMAQHLTYRKATPKPLYSTNCPIPDKQLIPRLSDNKKKGKDSASSLFKHSKAFHRWPCHKSWRQSSWIPPCIVNTWMNFWHTALFQQSKRRMLLCRKQCTCFRLAVENHSSREPLQS